MLEDNSVKLTIPLEVKLVRKEPDREASSDGSIVVFIVVLTVCFATVISAMFLLLVSDAWKHPTKKITTTQSLDHIPCRSYQFFKQSQYLNCAVHPSTVLTKQAIDCILSNPNWRNQLGAAGRMRVEIAFSWDSVASRLSQLYGTLLSQATPNYSKPAPVAA